jgi:predicted O-linked N-acetylglucosamine transferase (SPINDLY family)
MPLPLMPAGEPYKYKIFDNPRETVESEMAVASRFFSKEPDDADCITLLEIIDRHQDNIVSAAAEIVAGYNEPYYDVPQTISDNLLLKLKSEGYCHGHGRTVRFSDKAKIALKKRYLQSENKFRRERVKKKIL